MQKKQSDLLKKIGQSDLSLAEKGMLTVLLPMNPDEISLSVRELTNILKDKPGTITRVLKQLEKKGTD